ncbi:MAG: diadenylate cyclase CdaA [Geminocystis sp.]|nr:diadenylate cyclase CdaA [Geminocystis sp.]
MFGWGFPDNLSFHTILRFLLDVGLVISFFYFVSFLFQERRAQWIIRGLLFLFLLLYISEHLLRLTLFAFILERLAFICTVSLAITFQSDFRRFLEGLGRLQIQQFFQSPVSLPREESVIDEIVEAVKDLSQNRIGALIVIETFNIVEERVFINPGVKLNALVSKELLQTIFQSKSLLHDGAVFIRGSEIVAAGVILPLSERTASRQLGTRHRAAMGITERVENCICIVVSEETGSISLGEKGLLNRPLTATKLRELLEEKLSKPKESEVVTGVTRLGRKIRFSSKKFFSKLIRKVVGYLKGRPGKGS